MEKCIRESDINAIIIDIKNLNRDMAIHDTKIETQGREIGELKKLYDLMYNMATNLAIMTNEVTGIKEDVKGVKKDVEDVKKDVEDIKQAPAVDARHYKRTVIAGIITTIVGFILGKVFT